MAERGSWLTGPDQFMACIATVLLDKHRRRTIDYKEIPQLISVLSLLGFTPKDRAKLKVPESNTPNEHISELRRVSAARN